METALEEVATMVDLSPRATSTTRPRSMRWTVSAAVTAASAWFGAAGLAFGFLAYPDRLAHRLPFESPVFGGCALAVIIAVPFTVLAVLAWRGHPIVHAVGLWSGLVLVGWIAVQLLVVRELSVLHPLCAAAGAAFAYAGRDARPHHR